MVFAAALGRQTNVTASLVIDVVVKSRQRFRQVMAGEVARQPHAAITSSRTLCNRMSFGRPFSSGK